MRLLATYDHNVVYVLLLLLVTCAVASWIARLWKFDISSAEDATNRLLAHSALFLTSCLVLLSISGLWTGLARAGDSQLSLVGLIPFSDAGGYLSYAQDFYKDGIMDGWVLRRPWAAAARTALLGIAGLSYTNMMLLQGLLLSGAICFGARAINRWRGTYAAGIYVCLMFMACRSFLTTPLTEGVGLFWALLGIPFLIGALRFGSLRDALVGLCLTTLSLMNRMGAMFLVPSLVLWIVWRFGKGIRQKCLIGLAAISIVLVFAVGNVVLEKIYGGLEVMPGGNFAYTMCGLSLGPGSTWSSCLSKYDTELHSLPSGAPEEPFLARKALANIVSDPKPLIKALWSNFHSFLYSWTGVLISGYDAVQPPPWFRPRMLTATAYFGLAWLMWRRRETKEISFWLLVCVAVGASASLVWADDGRRVMSSAYPLMATFLASGLFRPSHSPAVRPRSTAAHTAALVLVFSSIVFAGFGPLFLARLGVGQNNDKPAADADSNVYYVYGGARSTGVLVMPDGADLPITVPSLHFSEFERLVVRSRIEPYYHGLIHPTAPKPPFGFIEPPRMEKDRSGAVLFIVPPEVMLQKDVYGWRLTTMPWQSKPGVANYWFFVTQAEPIEKVRSH
jgi:hypothetical protein